MVSRQKFLGNVVRTALFESIGTFSGERSTLKLFSFFFLIIPTERKNMGLCQKITGHGFQKCTLVVEETRLTKNLFFLSKKRSFLNVLLHGAENCWPLAGNFFFKIGKIAILIVMGSFFSVYRIIFRRFMYSEFFSLCFIFGRWAEKYGSLVSKVS